MTMQARPTGFRVLVLEDSLNDQEMIRRAIRGIRRDADINCVNTIAAARHLLNARPFDAVLCDNSLPDGRGSEFALELAHDSRFETLPIGVVSGWPSPFMWDKVHQAGLKMIDKTDNPVGKLHEFVRKSLRAQSAQGAQVSATPYAKLSAFGGRA